MNGTQKDMSIRPYQLMCIVCKLGAGQTAENMEGKLGELYRKMRQNIDIPVTLRCNMDLVYKYQNPGREGDTPEGELFNEKRDLDILQKLGLVPGSTRPALELFDRLKKKIKTTDGICGYDEVTSETWAGCADAKSGNFEKGIAKNVRGKKGIMPDRDKKEMAQVKIDSCNEMYQADMLLIRPHHLMCITCFHGGRDNLKPIAIDNLFEAFDIMRNNPDVPVKLVRGCCMICDPCNLYNPRTKNCSGHGMSVRDQRKDLTVLQILGLKYGDVLPARDLYALVFDRIHSTTPVCGYGTGVETAFEWSICGGPKRNKGYVKARERNLDIF